jgi:hypothetical protein
MAYGSMSRLACAACGARIRVYYGASQHKGATEVLVGLVEHVTFHNAGNGADAGSRPR